MLKDKIISKINDIQIAIVSSVELKLTNNYEIKRNITKDKKTNIKEGSGAVDLGFGNVSYSFSFHAKEKKDDNELHSILTTSRVVKFSDPFWGEFDIYLKEVSRTNTFTNSETTIYSIDCILKYKDWEPKVNYSFQVKAIKDIEKKNLLKDIKKFSKEAKKTELNLGKIPYPTEALTSLEKGVSFLSPVINNLSHNLNTILSIARKPQDLLKVVKASYTGITNLFDSLLSLKDIPENFYNSLVDLIDDITKEDTPYKKKKIVKTYLKGETVSNIGYENISSYDKKKLNLVLTVNNIVNRTALLVDLTKLETGGVKDKSELESIVDSVFEFFDYFVEFDKEEIDREIVTSLTYQKRKTIIIGHMLSYDVYNLIDVYLEDEESIIKYVYEKYGNLDNLNAIAKINNLKNVSLYKGPLKVFE